MKLLMTLFMMTFLFYAPTILAQEAVQPVTSEKESMVKMYSCSMDGYTSKEPGTCPLCGMKLSEKMMTEDEAKKALETSKSE